MNQRVVEPTSEPSAWALRNLAARAATFLYAIAADVSLRGVMRTAGYTLADHEEGQTLLRAACAYRASGHDSAEDVMARRAEAALFAWATTHLERYRVAIERVHPEQSTLFAQLACTTPAQAVLAVDILLRRVAALPSRGRASSVRKTLARRGLTPDERTRLQELVNAAQAVTTPELDAEVASASSAGASSAGALGERGRRSVAGTSSGPEQTLGSGTARELERTSGSGNSGELERTEPGRVSPEVLALYRWYADWAVTARAVVRRKDWLERMGVYRRRRG